MLFGFVIPAQGGGSNYGVISASREIDAKDRLCEEFELTYPDVEICDPEELIGDQYPGFAFLTTET